jgi:hypothetical protein
MIYVDAVLKEMVGIVAYSPLTGASVGHYAYLIYFIRTLSRHLGDFRPFLSRQEALPRDSRSMTGSAPFCLPQRVFHAILLFPRMIHVSSRLSFSCHFGPLIKDRLKKPAINDCHFHIPVAG